MWLQHFFSVNRFPNRVYSIVVSHTCDHGSTANVGAILSGSFDGKVALTDSNLFLKIVISSQSDSPCRCNVIRLFDQVPPQSTPSLATLHGPYIRYRISKHLFSPFCPSHATTSTISVSKKWHGTAQDAPKRQVEGGK